jgi:hypothetical protein
LEKVAVSSNIKAFLFLYKRTIGLGGLMVFLWGGIQLLASCSWLLAD